MQRYVICSGFPNTATAGASRVKSFHGLLNSLPFLRDIRVYIQIHRRTDVGVPKEGADGFHVAAGFDAPRREGVPQTMEVDAGDLQLRRDLIEMLSQYSWVHRCAGAGTYVVFRIEYPAKRLNGGSHPRRKGNYPFRGMCLRAAGGYAAPGRRVVVPAGCAGDCHCSFGGIDILPSKGAGLPYPHAS